MHNYNEQLNTIAKQFILLNKNINKKLNDISKQLVLLNGKIDPPDVETDGEVDSLPINISKK